MGIDNVPEEIVQALMPFVSEKLSKAKATNNLNFVHYTSADSLLKILNSKEVWFRNAATMNDFSEVQFGLERLAEAWTSDVGQKMRSMLQKLNADAVDKLLEFHNGWQPSYSTETFLFSVSEHLSSENSFGRLSMWREYARKSGVALVLNRAAFETETNLLKAYTVPVFYADSEVYLKNFNAMYEALLKHEAAFAAAPDDALWNPLFQVFRFMSLATKHPGFEEEAEWRVVYNPSMESSPYFTEKIVSISGVPQKVHALALKRIEAEGEELDLSLDALVQRIIVGPAEHQFTIGDAIISVLDEAGVSNASEKVSYSNIPVRI